MESDDYATIAILFALSFDTVDSLVIVWKLHAIRMSRTALEWFVNYLSTRRQFVQVNDKQSETVRVKFGVPQDCISGSFLVNVNGMENCLQDGCICLQYADNTTVYQHSTPKDLDNGMRKMNLSLHNIQTWAMHNNLQLNERKTKQMIVTTRQMSKVRT